MSTIRCSPRLGLAWVDLASSRRSADIQAMYPSAKAFANKLRELDPDGVFHGRLLARVFPRAPARDHVAQQP
ncbi:hypothetical protein DB30_05901 [Enhygromyxa salina]|uniref:Uncharacterized protein n=1 Tax=Enhygromyxa salina TaxID=215803 RepID=A0A0C2CVY6_9BACT|nr:hypothetical protein DB30_05901 [Enhygromyxa salina]